MCQFIVARAQQVHRLEQYSAALHSGFGRPLFLSGLRVTHGGVDFVGIGGLNLRDRLAGRWIDAVLGFCISTDRYITAIEVGGG